LYIVGLFDEILNGNLRILWFSGSSWSDVEALNTFLAKMEEISILVTSSFRYSLNCIHILLSLYILIHSFIF